jgi:MoaA/NifB/PqqE/SkfB family radical SAM enzyme
VNEYPAVGGTVNCVVTRHNIPELADFVKGITEYGKSRITITFQPYHPPPSFSEISCELDQEMTKRLWSCFKDRPPENLAPRDGLKQSLEKEIQKLVNLKREGFPIRNSEIYLRRIPEFLMDGKLPRDFSCIAGYTGFFMRYDLKVLPCYRLPPAGDACKEDLAEIWFSGKYRRQRKKMKRLFCHGCMFLCYNDPGCSSSAMTWKFYDCIYKRHDIPGKH